MEEHHQETAEEGAQASHQQHGHWGDTAQLYSEARSSSQSSPPLTQSTHRSGRAPADPTSHEQRGTWKHLSQLPTGPEGIHRPRCGELQGPQYGVSRCGHLTPVFLPLVSFQNDSHGFQTLGYHQGLRPTPSTVSLGGERSPSLPSDPLDPFPVGAQCMQRRVKGAKRKEPMEGLGGR